MTTLLLRYHVAENDVQTVVHAVEAAFAGLEEEHPKGLRFTYYRVAETAEFVGIVDRVAIGAPPLPLPLKAIGTYGR